MLMASVFIAAQITEVKQSASFDFTLKTPIIHRVPNQMNQEIILTDYWSIHIKIKIFVS